MMDVTSRYDPDFIYTDGTDQGPFSGSGTGAGYRCNAMLIVMADFYNRTLKERGRVDSFSIVKFRRPTNGTVNTAEFGFPDDIDTTQTWIRETPVGDWYYSPGFVYDAGSVERFIIESVCRDGYVALNIPICPDGSLEAACEEMLEEVGRWMEVNGQGIYGSRAWPDCEHPFTGSQGRPDGRDTKGENAGRQGRLEVAADRRSLGYYLPREDSLPDGCGFPDRIMRRKPA